MFDWNLEQVTEGAGGHFLATLAAKSIEVTGFSIDSRTIRPGEVFIALKGENHDGHRFIPQVVQAGVAAVIAETGAETGKPVDTVPRIQVKDTLEALQNMARWHRRRHPGLFLGVTGSNGKTTTKEMTAHLFSQVTTLWSTSGNLNNHIGLPLNLVRIPLSRETAIMEMGMNHAGEIRFLAEIARPSSGLITNVGPAHIGNLGSLSNIALAKAEMLENLPENGVAVLPGDDPFLSTLRSKTKARVLTFGFDSVCDMRGVEVQMLPAGIDLQVEYGGKRLPLRLQLLGKHNALNALAALALFVSCGYPLEQGVQSLSGFRPVAARMESHQIDGMRVILDCYNANPSSMKQAIEFLGVCKGRRVAVLGDMRELGETSEELHRQVGQQVARQKIDELVVVGDQAQCMAEAALQEGMGPAMIHSCRNTTEAASMLRMLMRSGDTLLLKASRGMYFEKIVKDLWPSLPVDLH